MKKYNVYRKGYLTFSDRVKAAIEYHGEKCGVLPEEILVNHFNVSDAKSAIKDLKLNIKVRETGGALMDEVWIEAAQ